MLHPWMLCTHVWTPQAVLSAHAATLGNVAEILLHRLDLIPSKSKTVRRLFDSSHCDNSRCVFDSSNSSTCEPWAAQGLQRGIKPKQLLRPCKRASDSNNLVHCAHMAVWRIPSNRRHFQSHLAVTKNQSQLAWWVSRELETMVQFGAESAKMDNRQADGGQTATSAGFQDSNSPNPKSACAPNKQPQALEARQNVALELELGPCEMSQGTPMRR